MFAKLFAWIRQGVRAAIIDGINDAAADVEAMPNVAGPAKLLLSMKVETAEPIINGKHVKDKPVGSRK